MRYLLWRSILSDPLRQQRWRRWRAGRGFYALCAAIALNSAAIELGLPFLPSYFSKMGVTSEAALLRWSGASVTVTFLAAMLAAPLWGYLGDRFGHRKMVIRAHLGLFVALVMLAAAQTPQQALLARALQGTLAGVIPSALALVSCGRNCARRMAWVQTWSTAGLALGPMLGGFLLEPLGVSGLYLAGAAMSLGCVALVAGLVGDTGCARPEKKKGGQPTRVLAPFLLAAWLFTWRSMEDIILPVYLQIHGGEDWHYWLGLCLTVCRLSAMVCGPFWGSVSQSYGATSTLRFTLAGTALFTLAQVMFPTLWLLVAVRCFLGVFRGGVVPALYLWSAETSGGQRGAALARTSAGLRLGRALGGACAGVLAGAMGLGPVIVTMGLAALGAAHWLRRR